MKKLFFAICFTSLLSFTTISFAKVTQMLDAADMHKTPKEILLPEVEGLPDPNDQEAVFNFFKKRFQTASFSSAESLGDVTKTNSMDVQHSQEYIEEMAQEKKSTFEKIYETAMQRISEENLSGQPSSQTIFYTEATDKNVEMAKLNTPDIPVVNVTLPTGTQIVAPAREHIPYMLTSINILPTGLIQIDEEITVIANNQKLKNGVVKILPKFSTSRSKVKKKLDIDLLSVSVNGQNIPHILEEIGNKIYIKPQQKYTLAPGVYTYKFSYLLDRKLWYYDDFTEFYWDVTGSYFNLVVTSANAIISIPDGKSFISQNAIIGNPGQLSNNRSIVAKLDSNALGFASLTPLLPAEGMHILVSLDKNTFLKPDFNRNFTWFITDYGDILFAIAGLLSVVLSYMISWNYIKKNKTKTYTSFKNNAPALRYFAKNLFDTKSFISWLLELKKRQYIDIQKQEKNILIIKKTDNLSRLNKKERKALNNLFSKQDSVISVNAQNALKFKRAYQEIENWLQSTIKKLNFKLNIGYLAFSISMLILAEIAIAMIGINSWQTIFILLSSSSTVAFYLYILRKKFKSKILGCIAKFFAVIFIVFAVLLMSIYIHLLSALIIAAIIYSIFEYSVLFTKRNGLMKSKIKETDELKNYLEKNAQIIGMSQEFITQEANIYALELNKFYQKNEHNTKNYVLDIAKEIENLLI